MGTMQGEDGFGYVAASRTDTNGRFEIFDFPLQPWSNERGQLTFEHQAMLRSAIHDIYGLPIAERKKLRVTLRRGHEVKGRVTSAEGRPVPGALVEALPSDPHAQYKQERTDAEGRFVIRGLPEGEVVIRTHALALKQKAHLVVRLAERGAEANLRLEPVVLKASPQPVRLFGMKLTDLTPELQAAHDLSDAKGVLIVSPGENHARLGIGTLEEGEYFWMIGDKAIANLTEMVTELLRICRGETSLTGGGSAEGDQRNIRIVYSNQHRSNTQYLQLTGEDVTELKNLAAAILR